MRDDVDNFKMLYIYKNSSEFMIPLCMIVLLDEDWIWQGLFDVITIFIIIKYITYLVPH